MVSFSAVCHVLPLVSLTTVWSTELIKTLPSLINVPFCFRKSITGLNNQWSTYLWIFRPSTTISLNESAADQSKSYCALATRPKLLKFGNRIIFPLFFAFFYKKVSGSDKGMIKLRKNIQFRKLMLSK